MKDNRNPRSEGVNPFALWRELKKGPVDVIDPVRNTIAKVKRRRGGGLIIEPTPSEQHPITFDDALADWGDTQAKKRLSNIPG